jgi:hypothetical protein
MLGALVNKSKCMDENHKADKSRKWVYYLLIAILAVILLMLIF